MKPVHTSTEGTERQYGREDVSFDTWYSAWSKLLAKTYTRAELEKRAGIASDAGSKAARSHLRAIQATHSMTSQSQRRAQTGNVSRAVGEERMAITGALEIYDLFPEHTKAAA
jgi:hypothetical protein